MDIESVWQLSVTLHVGRYVVALLEKNNSPTRKITPMH